MSRRIRHVHDEAEREWLGREIPLHTIRETARLFSDEFGREIPEASVKSFQRSHGLTFVRATRRPKRESVWTPERDEFVRGYVPGHTENETIDAFEERFGVRLTRPQISNRRHTLGVRHGTHGGCFKKGNVPANKGTRGMMKANSGSFKRGYLPHDTRPLLDERVTKDGYIEIHVGLHRMRKRNDQWMSKARFVYEREHGELPDKMMVVFADGDKRNFSPDNLVAMTMAQHATICHLNIKYHDRATCETAMRIADLSHAAHAAECRERTCPACGCRFRARYPQQRRCDNCIDNKITVPRATPRRKVG